MNYLSNKYLLQTDYILEIFHVLRIQNKADKNPCLHQICVLKGDKENLKSKIYDVEMMINVS